MEHQGICQQSLQINCGCLGVAPWNAELMSPSPPPNKVNTQACPRSPPATALASAICFDESLMMPSFLMLSRSNWQCLSLLCVELQYLYTSVHLFVERRFVCRTSNRLNHGMSDALQDMYRILRRGLVPLDGHATTTRNISTRKHINLVEMLSHT